MRDQENITSIDQYVIDFVRDLRIKHNLTQEALGNILAVSRSFIRDIESTNSRGKYNLRHINALSDYFGLSPKDFLPEKPFPINLSEIKNTSDSKNVKKGKTPKQAAKK